MPATVTPIRYPGGKTKLYDFVRSLLKENNLIGGTYCEPFAGGAGLALKLLQKGDVDSIVINDADPAIYSIWRMILSDPEELCAFINDVNITISEWEKQRQIYLNNCMEPGDDLAKATFFLNRTNVSGVITGGVIGGRNQEGTFKINARFNKENLIRKIKKIAEYKEKIELYNLDVLDFMDEVFPMFTVNTFVNFDPPYVKKGNKLYKNAFTEEDHKKLSERIINCNQKWIVTYDVCDFVKDLYKDVRGEYINVYYSANEVRKAQEYVFYSNELILLNE